MYEFGALLPPTPLQMERRRVPLETLRVWWVHSYGQIMEDTPSAGCVEECDAEPTVRQLAVFIADHAIPHDAVIRHHLFGIELVWTHLELCEVCNMWAEPHDETDKFHALMLSTMEPEGNPVAQVAA